MKKVALYDPYLNILGGGERYVLSILKVFAHHGYQPIIFWDSDLTKKIKDKFSLQFNLPAGRQGIKLEFVPNIFKNRSFPSSTLKKLQSLRTFDYFLYVTDGGYFFSSAKKNYIYAMVPQQSLYSKSLINRLKMSNYTFITHSKFTQNQLTGWGIQTKLLYPYIDIPDILSLPKKEKIILCVGRFFKHLHSKRQDLTIKAFLLLKKNPVFHDYKLIIVGGLQKEDETYFTELESFSHEDPSIELKPNISYNLLTEYYKKSMFYWHFAGFGIDENRHPELVEHMGITPIEAMTYGSIPFCYAAGGPKEIISQGENGFLFHNEDELMKQMLDLQKNQDRIQSIQKQGMEFARKNFSYSVFEKNVIKLFQL